MELIIGGRFQGKLDFVLRKYGADRCAVTDGALPDRERLDRAVSTGRVIVIDRLNVWIRDRLSAGGDPEGELRTFLNDVPDAVVICDEIGNGIVPADRFEREYRERTGRILVDLAQKAGGVVRVICGIGQKIK